MKLRVTGVAEPAEGASDAAGGPILEARITGGLRKSQMSV